MHVGGVSQSAISTVHDTTEFPTKPNPGLQLYVASKLVAPSLNEKLPSDICCGSSVHSEHMAYILIRYR